MANSAIFKIDLVLAKLKETINKLPSIVQAALFTSAQHILVPNIKNRLKSNRSIFRGELFQRVNVELVSDGKDRPAINVGSLGVPYGYNVEKGAPPHQPDNLKILDYVEKKMGMSGIAASMVAGAIVHTIKTKGTKKHPFVLPVYRTKKQELIDDIVRRIGANLP